jgi:biopolymer transport protein ExbD
MQMVFRTYTRRRRITMLNVISLVDVLFVLVLFFVLTTTFRRHGELKLDLPKSTTAVAAGAGESQQQSELVLLADGAVMLDGKATEQSALPARLAQIAGRASGQRILIKAESGARHGDVVHLLDLVREAGFAGVSVGTELAPLPGRAGR